MEGKRRTRDLFEQIRDVLVVERQLPAQQHKQDHAAAPDIHLGAGVQLPADDFGSGVVWRSARSLKEVTVGHDVAEAEVGNLDVQVRVEEQVFWLQIAMHDLVAMAVFDGADDLLEKPPSRVFGDLAVADEKIEQLPPGILDHHDDLLRGGDDGVPLFRQFSPHLGHRAGEDKIRGIKKRNTRRKAHSLMM